MSAGSEDREFRVGNVKCTVVYNGMALDLVLSPICSSPLDLFYELYWAGSSSRHILTVYLSTLSYRISVDVKRLSVYSTHMDSTPDRQFLVANQSVIFALYICNENIEPFLCC
jgi:hypothetical protein